MTPNESPFEHREFKPGEPCIRTVECNAREEQYVHGSMIDAGWHIEEHTSFNVGPVRIDRDSFTLNQQRIEDAGEAHRALMEALGFKSPRTPAYRALKEAAVKVLQAKGRYHTQLAMCELAELLGFPAVWPDNHPKAKGGQQ